MNFKINSRPLFTIIFKLKNDNFKTRDFSPLIERALAGVNAVSVQSKENFNDYLAMFCLYTLPLARPAQAKIQILIAFCSILKLVP